MMDTAYLNPPKHIPWYIRAALWVVKQSTGKDLLPPRLLAWYPKAAISSGVLEALVAHGEPGVDDRMLKMVRMTVSFTAVCPFCMDMNSVKWEQYMSEEELAALQGSTALEVVSTFSTRERLAVSYARLLSQTPLQVKEDFVTDLKQHFSEREIVIIATTAAQVNYWARLIQALGCPPAGFMS